MEIQITQPHKSIHSTTFSLPDFCVLTGKNGSGKSHLMEAMSNSENAIITDGDDIRLSNIKYVPFNGLNPSVQTTCLYDSFSQDKKQSWRNIQSAITSYLNRSKLQRDIAKFDEIHFAKDPSTKKILSRLLQRCGVVENITEEDFNNVYDLIPNSPNELFTSQFASIFKLYHSRMEDNEYNRYRNKEKGEGNVVLSDEEFEKLYGPKPWDLINQMLDRAAFLYRVNSPEGDRKEDDFQLVLYNPTSDVKIDVNDLSTGEKVLMSLALAIYNTSESDNKPDILLLDEPDAPLHPEFSEILLSSIQEFIVKNAGIKVMISTHNPTTVAIAPEESIYKMDKELGYPIKVEKKHALSILTRDLDNVRISTDSRRQVFVENQNDVEYYEKLIRLLPELKVQCQFLPPHTKNGCNCDDVIRVVKLLREMGNDTVFGLIDFDNTRDNSEFVFVIGDKKRYAIENYVLDPIFIGFTLIRERIISTKDLGLKEYTFTALHALTNEEIQAIINYVVTQLGLNSEETISYSTIGGDTFSMPKEYASIQGHELEEKIIEEWPKLNAIKKGRNDEKIFKVFVLDHIINEFPQFISSDIFTTFSRII